jgi:integrase
LIFFGVGPFVGAVRFTHAGGRQHRSTHARDLAGVQVEAARIYAETVSGRRLQSRTEPLKELDVLFAEWLSQIESEIAPETWKTYQGYFTNHFLPFFESAERITASSTEDYSRMRLRKVTRSTVAKELSAFRNFLSWPERRKEIDEAPLVRNPPRRSTGTAFDGGKRDKVRVSLTSEQAEAIIDLLPERTPVAGHPIKALFTVIWDTSLRIGTMWRLEVPKHYKHGDDVLRISQDIDKSRYARSVPLTPRARRVLDAICPEEGFIFRPFEYRRILVQAARKVLGTEHEARDLSAHDFRHAALTHMAAVGSDLTEIGHVAGHKNATTTGPLRAQLRSCCTPRGRSSSRNSGHRSGHRGRPSGEVRPPVPPKFSQSLGDPNDAKLEPIFRFH